MRVRRVVWRVAIVALAAMVSTAPVVAAGQDIVQGPIGLGLIIGGGGTFRGELPSNTFYNGLGYNVLAGLVLKPATLPASLRLEGMYNAFFSPLSVYETHVYSATANGQYNLHLTPFFHPYIIGGVGYYHLDAQEFNPNQAPGNPTEITEPLNGVGLNGGAGIRSGGPGFGFFAEWRYHYVFAGGKLDPGGHTSFAPFTFGLVF